MNKDEQLRAAINQKLIETGERERLKELLRAKLIECGWKDQLKAHCKEENLFKKRKRKILNLQNVVFQLYFNFLKTEEPGNLGGSAV
uniref:Transcription and mRNA export factor ENY2 n=1 Tax=Canis lupus familiaris TaxID=9615 RepID=A0A8C0S559_CANLF